MTEFEELLAIIGAKEVTIVRLRRELAEAQARLAAATKPSEPPAP